MKKSATSHVDRWLEDLREEGKNPKAAQEEIEGQISRWEERGWRGESFYYYCALELAKRTTKELSQAIAKIALLINGFTNIRIGHGDGRYYFKIWANHPAGLEVGIMQVITEEVIKVYITQNNKFIWPKCEPFNGSCKAFPTLNQLDSLLERVASGEFKK